MDATTKSRFVNPSVEVPALTSLPDIPHMIQRQLPTSTRIHAPTSPTETRQRPIELLDLLAGDGLLFCEEAVAFW